MNPELPAPRSIEVILALPPEAEVTPDEVARLDRYRLQVVKTEASNRTRLALARQRAAENLRVAELRFENTPNTRNRIKLIRARSAAREAGLEVSE